MILAKVHGYFVCMFKYVSANPTIMDHYNAPMKCEKKSFTLHGTGTILGGCPFFPIYKYHDHLPLSKISTDSNVLITAPPHGLFYFRVPLFSLKSGSPFQRCHLLMSSQAAEDSGCGFHKDLVLPSERMSTRPWRRLVLQALLQIQL